MCQGATRLPAGEGRVSDWIRCTPSERCPICDGPDWCQCLKDGTKALCMRVEANSYKAIDTSIGTAYLHNLRGDRQPTAERPRRTGPAARRADPDTLHAAYGALLAELGLHHRHREALHRRGLCDDAIDRRGYRSVPGADRVH